MLGMDVEESIKKYLCDDMCLIERIGGLLFVWLDASADYNM